MLIWALSTWLNLYTLKWLMNQMFTFGVVAVFIIFQPELRRGLEQLGRGKLFGRSAAASDEELTVLIGEIIKSVNYLSRRKIGALVVFERETGLNDYTESGIKMHSLVSSELMINIFIPNTPLHDGAVIIQENRFRRQLVICHYQRILLSVRNWEHVTVQRSGLPKLQMRSVWLSPRRLDKCHLQ